MDDDGGGHDGGDGHGGDDDHGGGDGRVSDDRGHDEVCDDGDDVRSDLHNDVNGVDHDDGDENGGVESDDENGDHDVNSVFHGDRDHGGGNGDRGDRSDLCDDNEARSVDDNNLLEKLSYLFSSLRQFESLIHWETALTH